MPILKHIIQELRQLDVDPDDIESWYSYYDLVG